MKLLRADLHIHTLYSMDCSTSLEEIIERCQDTGINCIAIADHDAVEGAIQMQRQAPFTVIVAEEILTPNGEIMGMFLKERIPSGISLEQALTEIKAQGGLVNIPHPFDPLRGIKLDNGKLAKLADQIDIIEVFNARSPLPVYATKARNFARKHNLAGTVGSDAHTPGEIGGTYVEMPEFKGKEDFLKALAKGKVFSHQSSPLVHFSSTWARLKKSLDNGHN
ncbi:MAG: PHP domain-containing protein [Chloroflexota bacterium]